MQTTSSQLFRAAGALTATSLALAATRLCAVDNSAAFPSFDSYIKISGQAASIGGNGAAYQTRPGRSDDAGAGVEAFHYGRDVAKDVTMTLDGRALSGVEDYLFGIKLEKSGLGSVDFGYKSFRTFYDGVGGFFPQNNAWMPLSQVYPEIGDGLHVDRGRFWAEAKFAREDGPGLAVRYVNETRSGKKDSLIWGDTDNTGQNYGTLNGGLTGANANAQVRKNIPSYLDLDERHQSLEGTIKHTVGKTEARLSLLGDWTSLDNGRFVTRFPGETRAANAAGTGVTPAVGSAAANWATFNNQVAQSQFDRQDTSTGGITGTTITELNDKLTLRVGASYQDVSSDFGGDRIIVTNQPITGNAARTIQTYAVKDLDGASEVDVYTGSVGLDYQFTPTFVSSLALRGEDRDANSNGAYDVVTSTTGAAPAATTTHRLEASSIEERSLTPVLDLRYTGIRDLALFSSASRKFGRGTEVLTPAYNPVTVKLPNIYTNDVDEDNAEYSVGGSWRACPGFTLRGEPFIKDNVYHARGGNTNSSATTTPATPTVNNNYELDSQFWGVKLTAIAKPLATVSLTTRYIWQKGERQVTGFLPLYPEYDSMDSVTHTIGETIDWNPTPQFYFQAGVNLVINTMSTAYQHDLSTAATGVIPANRFIQKSENDYVTFNVLAGLAVTEKDDVELQFTAYKADNYDADLALYTQPYGASATETTVTVGLKHKFSKVLLGQAKVGYIDNRNETTGGFTDYHGPLGYLSLTYQL